MSQTDDIHESFYDLFNQRFRRIDDPDHGPRYYTNIAIGAHLKLCRVHTDFQCVVVVRWSEVVTHFVVAHFVAGKPIIRDIDSIRTVFKFCEEDNGHSLTLV